MTDAPFAPGDRVIRKGELHANTVAECHLHPHGHWLIRCDTTAPGYLIAPAELYKLAPVGFEDAPPAPTPRYAGLTLSEIYGSKGRECIHDEDYHARMVDWLAAMTRWMEKWGNEL